MWARLPALGAGIGEFGRAQENIAGVEIEQKRKRVTESMNRSAANEKQRFAHAGSGG
jgi:hypothetical protein